MNAPAEVRFNRALIEARLGRAAQACQLLQELAQELAQELPGDHRLTARVADLLGALGPSGVTPAS